MHSLRFKILATAATLVLLSQAGTVTTVLVTARQDVANRADRALETSAEVLLQATISQTEQFASTVQALAGDYGFKQAVGMNDVPTIESALANHARRAGADIAILVDQDKQLLATTGAASLPHQWLEKSRNHPGSDQNYFAFINEGSAYVVVTAAIRAPLPIAWLSMGYKLSNAHAVKLRNLTGTDISIISNDEQDSQIVASSLSADQINGIFNAIIESPKKLSYSSPADRIKVGNQELLALYRPMINNDGSLSVLFTKSMDDAMAPYRLLRTAAIALGGIPLLFGLAGAVLLSRSLTKPIQKLMLAAQRIQSGDYTSLVSIRSGDELKEFAAAFNAMQVEIAERETRISYQSRHDSVTGLYNRDYILELMKEQLDEQPENGHLAVMLITLGAINDVAGTLGHDISDSFLKQAANQLRQLMDERHPIARIDGDFFLILLNNCDAVATRLLAEHLITHFKDGVHLTNLKLTANPRIAIALYPEHGRDRDQLLRRATLAINADPELRRPVRFYRDGDEELRVRNLTLLRDLEHAITNGQLELHYQPKIRVADETIAGAEALVRWNHPRYGKLSPVQFIPIIEQAGNISLITRWALETAARQHKVWAARGMNLQVAINVSSHDLLDQNLPWLVMDALRTNDMPAHDLVIEITEEAMVRNFSQAATVLQRLRDLGIKVAIDDFGTGYSSLSQLKRLPVDQLKIDKSFVARLPDDGADKIIISSSVELAHKLHLDLVAEGVESGAAFRWIQDSGIEQAQGYYWSPPLPPAAFTEWAEHFSGGATQQSKILQLI
jgi:diguanylate cyclase (GGDEF)-like protein